MTFPVKKLGFVHHMLYPGYRYDEAYHADTVIELSEMEDIGCFDCCLPLDEVQRGRAVKLLKNCGKIITYANHLFPAQKISLGTADFAELSIIKSFIANEIETAAAIGAKYFMFVSGRDIPDSHDEAVERFKEIAVWICGRLEQYDIIGLIEPLDTSVDKRFLIGSTRDGCGFVESIAKITSNIRLEIDTGHIPCLFEDFEASYRLAAPFLGQVHLSSCFLGNPRDLMFGDKHPSFFYPGASVTKQNIQTVLRVLKETGYLNSDNPITFEVNPLPGENPCETIKAHISMLDEIYRELVSGVKL